MYQMLLMEPAVARCLNDRIVAVSVPHAAPINFARVIEGIRELISPGKMRLDGWLCKKLLLRGSLLAIHQQGLYRSKACQSHMD